LGVISTVNSKGNPEAATMVVSQTEDLKLIFQTPNHYRKFKNIKNNSNVAITFGFSMDEFTTVQYEGVAKEAGADEIEICRNIHVAKNPKSKDYAYLPDNKYFIVSPKWARYWDFNKDEHFELEF
jgi:general stress protein 26